MLGWEEKKIAHARAHSRVSMYLCSGTHTHTHKSSHPLLSVFFFFFFKSESDIAKDGLEFLTPLPSSSKSWGLNPKLHGC